ncbi:MAG TPA: GtrA family protein [Pseudonocardiaceae bacterium]
MIGEDDDVVSTESYLTSAQQTARTGEPVDTGDATPVVAPAPRRRRWLPSRRLIARLGQFAVGSVVSTIVSQATLTGFYYWGHATAFESSAAAFVAGAIPAFLINWRWTWSRSGKPSVLTELVPYFAITLTGGLAATGLTTLADKLINPLIDGRGGRSLVLDCAYLGSYGVFVLVKFTLLDRLMTRKRRVPAAA